MSINKQFRVKHGLISDADVAVQGSVTATSFSGNGNALTNIDYINLINKPTIPTVPTVVSAFTNDSGYITSSSLTGLASQTYVQTQIANLVAAAPTTLDTLKEIADQLAADESVASALASQVALKANTSSLATVAFSGSYSDLTNRPNQNLNTTSDVTFNNLSLTGNITSGLTVVNPSSPYTVMSIKGDSTYTGSGGGQLKITNAAGTRFLEAGYNSSTLTGFLQVYNQGYSGPLMLNPDGGDVIIGADGSTTNIRTVLSLNGSTGVSGQVLKSNGNAKPSWLTLSTVAYSNSYTDLINKPTNVSSFTNDANYATQTYVNTQVSNLVNAAPATLDTLNELAAALGNDANFATTVTNSLATKANQSTTYTKTEVDTALGLKANLSGATFTGAITATTGTFTSLRNTGTTNLGSNTYAKSTPGGGGDIFLDNGTTDTPGLLMYYANNKNWGIDSYIVNGVQALRFVSDLNESGGAVQASIDINGKFVVPSVIATTSLTLPKYTSNPTSSTIGDLYYNTSDATLKLYHGSAWVTVKGFKDGSTAALAPSNANDLIDIGIKTSGVYWINLPVVGATQVYCDLTTDGGGWMMLGYAGSTAGVGDSNQMVYNTIGTISTTRSYEQTSFSRFDIARAMTGASSSSQLMWRRTNDSNKILIHSADEMWNRMPGGSSAGNRDMNGSGSGYPITTMKMSRTGTTGIENKTNGRYENGPGYPGIAWNSSYNDNNDNVGSFSTYLNRRQIVYWETNGPQSQSQWFHGSVLSLGDGSGPMYSQSRKDVEIYFRVRNP